ncbi:hypothetical protein ACVWXO_009525 [Bradyrhizobium sp. LM2.7]
MVSRAPSFEKGAAYIQRFLIKPTGDLRSYDFRQRPPTRPSQFGGPVPSFRLYRMTNFRGERFGGNMKMTILTCGDGEYKVP